MGAETSTINSIESLNNTLINIENKLNNIDKLHFHHESSISIDNTTIIANKLITCRSDVKLVVGPIIGIIGSNYARILIETDHNSDIILYLFNYNLFTDLNDSNRFIKQIDVNAVTNTPIAVTINDLQPSTSYAIYIGGIQYSDTINNYATFTTLPYFGIINQVKQLNNQINILTTYNERVDIIQPNDINVINKLKENIDESINILNPIHYIIHNSNVISIESILTNSINEALDILLNNDINITLWLEKLELIEKQIKLQYIKIFNQSNYKHILRKTANLFLTNKNEILSNLLDYYYKTFNNIDFNSIIERSLLTYTQNLSFEQQDDAEYNKLLNKVNSKSNDVESSVTINKQKYLYDMTRLHVSAIIRIARRVNWSYVRQLWDDNYEDFVTFDLEFEEILRNIVICKKKLEVDMNLYEHLNSSRLKFTKELKANKKQIEKISIKCRQMIKEIRATEEALARFSEMSNKLQNKYIANNNYITNNTIINLSGSLIVLLDSYWDIIGKDGLILFDYIPRESFIDNKILNNLEDLLIKPLYKPVHTVIDTQISASLSSFLSSNTLKIITSVVVVSSNNILSQINSTDKLLIDKTCMTISQQDINKLCYICCKWQQSKYTNAVVVIMPSVDNKPRFGWIFPKSIEKLIDNDYITVADSQTIDSKTENKTDSGVESTYNNKYKNKRKSQVDSLLIKQADEFDEDEDEGWDDLRCKLRTILLSKLHDFTTNKNLNQLVEYSIIDESESLSDSLVDQDIDSLLPNPLDSSLSNTVDADNKSTSGVIGSKPDNQIVLKSDKLNDSDVSSTLDIRRASKLDSSVEKSVDSKINNLINKFKFSIMFKEENDNKIISNQSYNSKSYWNLTIHPSKKPSNQLPVSSYINLTNVSISTNTNISNYELSYDPVVTFLSNHIVILIVETNVDKYLDIYLVDQITNEEYKLVLFNYSNKPTRYIFKYLKSNHFYNIYLPQINRFQSFGSFKTAYSLNSLSRHLNDNIDIKYDETAIHKQENETTSDLFNPYLITAEVSADANIDNTNELMNNYSIANVETKLDNNIDNKLTSQVSNLTTRSKDPPITINKKSNSIASSISNLSQLLFKDKISDKSIDNTGKHSLDLSRDDADDNQPNDINLNASLDKLSEIPVTKQRNKSVDRHSSRSVDNNQSDLNNKQRGRSADKTSIRSVDKQSVRSVDKQSIRSVDKQSIGSVDKQSIRSVDKQSVRSISKQSITGDPRSLGSVDQEALAKKSDRSIDNQSIRSKNIQIVKTREYSIDRQSNNQIGIQISSLSNDVYDVMIEQTKKPINILVINNISSSTTNQSINNLITLPNNSIDLLVNFNYTIDITIIENDLLVQVNKLLDIINRSTIDKTDYQFDHQIFNNIELKSNWLIIENYLRLCYRTIKSNNLSTNNLFTIYLCNHSNLLLFLTKYDITNDYIVRYFIQLVLSLQKEYLLNNYMNSSNKFIHLHDYYVIVYPLLPIYLSNYITSTNDYQTNYQPNYQAIQQDFLNLNNQINVISNHITKIILLSNTPLIDLINRSIDTEIDRSIDRETDIEITSFVNQTIINEMNQSYTINEIVMLLDLLYQWFNSNSSSNDREIVILSNHCSVDDNIYNTIVSNHDKIDSKLGYIVIEVYINSIDKNNYFMKQIYYNSDSTSYLLDQFIYHSKAFSHIYICKRSSTNSLTNEVTNENNDIVNTITNNLNSNATAIQSNIGYLSINLSNKTSPFVCLTTNEMKSLTTDLIDQLTNNIIDRDTTNIWTDICKYIDIYRTIKKLNNKKKLIAITANSYNYTSIKLIDSINQIFINYQCKKLINEMKKDHINNNLSYNIFTHYYYIETYIRQYITRLLDQIPSHVSILLPTPSTYTIMMIYQVYINKININSNDKYLLNGFTSNIDDKIDIKSISSKITNKSNSSNTDRNIDKSSSYIEVITMLKTDSKYLVRFIQNVFEAHVLSEQFSYLTGYIDKK